MFTDKRAVVNMIFLDAFSGNKILQRKEEDLAAPQKIKNRVIDDTRGFLQTLENESIDIVRGTPAFLG